MRKRPWQDCIARERGPLRSESHNYDKIAEQKSDISVLIWVSEYVGDLAQIQERSSRQKTLPGGSMLTMLPTKMQKAHGIPRVIEMVLSVPGAIAVNMASSYIYDKLKKHGTNKFTMTINLRTVIVDKDGISKVIEEETTIDLKR